MKQPISISLFNDFLKCKYKAYLKLQGKSGQKSVFEQLQISLAQKYLGRAIEHFLKSNFSVDVPKNGISLSDVINNQYKIVTNVTASEGDISVHFDALVRVSRPPSTQLGYIPVTFVHYEKITIDHKLTLAFCGSVLASHQGILPSSGKIIYGSHFVTASVKLATLINKAEEILRQIADLKHTDHPPSLCLNKHCLVCEFEKHCQKVAVEQDDLSLLRGLTEKEIVGLNKKGIFTVTQFSYTFRPRKKRKRTVKRGIKHYHSLQALALRTNTIYVARKPEFPSTKPRLYLDIEGIPEKGLYYLIGLLVCAGKRKLFYHWWADTKAEEVTIWQSFLAAVDEIKNFTLFHYGSYESRYFARMQNLYGCDSSLLEKICSNSINLLSLIHARIYFPTYSNGLKSIATYLGFKWSDWNASGIQSLVWRYQWEKIREDSLKKKLILYNHEDCLALQTVTNALESISSNDCQDSKANARTVVHTDDIRSEFPGIFKKNDFFFPEMDVINRCAYFDYQTSRVYLRTSPVTEQSLKRKERRKKSAIKIDKETYLDRPGYCPICNATSPLKYGKISKIVFDLKLFDGGIKRWVVRYRSCIYICKKCKKTFTPENIRSTVLPKYGHTLIAWVAYQNISLLKSYGTISEELHEIFNYNFTRGIIANFKRKAAEYYESTYQYLVEKIKRGSLIHIDETKVTIKGNDCYVWALTNLEETVYICTDTRECDFLKNMLDGFNGVLVSDFYTAYDSIDCVQQKCLIHLIRYINDDLFKNPFDEEYKEFARNFTITLAPIIETINKYGLKKRHLRKHKTQVQQFLGNIQKSNYISDLAKNYQRRIKKYKDKLFSFIDYNGVPWNNNNAENAIKRFVWLRRGIDGRSTKNGICGYLILLSICETLRRRNISALKFLVSGSIDIDGFL